jgi:hypothetical protein
VVEKALKLADEVLAKEYAPRLEIAKELRRLHSENEQLKSRQWVGLTNEEIFEIHTEWSDKVSWDGWNYERAIEAKLKEKNGG